MIDLKNISKKYGNRSIISDISAQIPKGKITSLIGNNGAGKSTLLYIMGRLLNQDNGAVLLGEKNIESYKNQILSQHLSILKQSNHLDLKLTVKELVSFGRFPYSQGKLNPEDHKKIEQAIHFLDLEDIQNQLIDELSGGQKQRAFLAMTVAQDTDCILLDEPLNNLDMNHAVQMMKTLRKLSDDLDKTIIIIIHEINFASCFSDYIIALKDTKIIHFDTTENIIQPQKLKEIFDIDFEIIERNGKRICNYFNS